MKVRLDEMKLAIAMVKKDFNTIKLAEKSGFSRTLISNAKSGKRIKLETAIKIANALGVEVTDILED